MVGGKKSWTSRHSKSSRRRGKPCAPRADRDPCHRGKGVPEACSLRDSQKQFWGWGLGGKFKHIGVLLGCFARKIDGPGLPGGLIIYLGHLFRQKDTYVQAPFSCLGNLEDVASMDPEREGNIGLQTFCRCPWYMEGFCEGVRLRAGGFGKRSGLCFFQGTPKMASVVQIVSP